MDGGRAGPEADRTDLLDPPHHVERIAGTARALHVELGSTAMVEVVTFGRMPTRVAVPDVGPAGATARARDDLVARVRAEAQTVIEDPSTGEGASAIGTPVTYAERVVAVVSAWFLEPRSREEVVQVLELAAIGLAGWWGSQEQRRDSEVAATLDAGRARERERRRLAYELHGSVAQELAAARITAETAELLAGNGQDVAPSPELLSNVHRHIKEAQGQTRRLINALSARSPEESTLSEIAEALCREYEQKLNVRGTVRVSLSIGDLPRATSAELNEAFAFVLREAMQNVYEHARGETVVVAATLRTGQLILSVTDDGIGLPPSLPDDEDRHLGLRGMRERLRSVGGSMAFGGGASGGTRVVATFPLDAEDRIPSAQS